MIEETLSIHFASRPEIRLAYLFGSQATGKTNAMSDVDVAVLIDPTAFEGSAPYGYKAHLGTALMQLLKTNRVDVVILNDAGYFLRHRVLAQGKNIFAKSELERVRFEADTMSRYPDIRRLMSAHWKES